MKILQIDKCIDSLANKSQGIINNFSQVLDILVILFTAELMDKAIVKLNSNEVVRL